MLLTILLAAIQLPQAAATQTSTSPADVRAFTPISADADKSCSLPMARTADENAPLRSRPFNELPIPGRLELAVYRQIGGCPIPAVLYEDFERRRR
jgi:hypothetical protein